MIPPDTLELSADSYLRQIAEEIQLSDTQYTQAQSAYEKAGKWIQDGGGLLARIESRFFPQGSMVLGTTVRPSGQEEFDLDAVCLLDLDSRTHSPRFVYELIWNRLAEHGDLQRRMTPKPRCIRLSYAGEFHLDIIPACPSPASQAGLLIPTPSGSRSTSSVQAEWKFSDPEGYAAWFKGRCQFKPPHVLLEREMDPAPAAQDLSDKDALQVFVQLIKDRRNSYYKGQAPASILITTMAGEMFQGESFSLLSLHTLVQRMTQRANSRAQALRVLNPTNQAEDFAAVLSNDEKAEFGRFLSVFADELARLNQRLGVRGITESLKRMFAPGAVDAALSRKSEIFAQAKNAGRLHSEPKTGIVSALGATATVKPNPPHTFHGDEA